MNFFSSVVAAAWLVSLATISAQTSAPGLVPAKAPRTFILAGEREAFREYCLKGPQKDFFAQLKAEFDEKWLKAGPPPEPQEYGDPSPKKRKGDMVDKWRAGQSASNQLAGTAEAAALIWLVTNESVYLEKAKEFLFAGCAWGEGASAHTRIEYNDEAHFRLWRKLPVVYDQIRDQLTAEEKKRVLASFQKRGAASFALIEKKTKDVLRNSIEEDASSHPVRFVSMTGISGLALWDDLPEAKTWYAHVLSFYKNQFPPWGGDDGGWGEGNAYWRGNLEHARFQDALCAWGSPEAYANPFWKSTGYFSVYFVQPYKHTAFGDTPNAGKFNLEPIVADLVARLARRFQDGYLSAYAKLQNKEERSLEAQGLYTADERYPSGMEYIMRGFATRQESVPTPKPLTELPPGRWFRDVGWMAMHSALGEPDNDIMLSFKSSPYASYSHSHADQNAFILNAYGENLIINAGYREFHRSEHHKGYTQRTLSKNAVLIEGQGQKPQAKEARGKILGLENGDRLIWTAGDAAEAYNTEQATPIVEEARRDIVMVDKRYFVLRDRVQLKEPKTVSLLLHAESAWQWEAGSGLIQQPKAGCRVVLASVGPAWKVETTDQFPVPVEEKYRASCPNQYHLSAASPAPAKVQMIYSVFWPWRGREGAAVFPVKVEGDKITVQRPDGKTDRITFTATGATIQ